MIRLPILSALVLASITACSAPPPQPVTPPMISAERPLDSLPGDASLQQVRTDLLATAADRFGPATLAEAQAAPAYLIAKRFAGMLPPPPPGQTTQYVPPAALLAKRDGGWMVAAASGWRPANAEAAAELDTLSADPAFWSDGPHTPACPDFGASLLLLQMPGKPETVRNSMCSSRASRIVEAALRA